MHAVHQVLRRARTRLGSHAADAEQLIGPRDAAAVGVAAAREREALQGDAGVDHVALRLGHERIQARGAAVAFVVLDACRDRLLHLADRHREKVSLIGWSLGGVYARELAKEFADRVRCVVTLGTPFSGHPRATNAWRFYEVVSGQSVADNQALIDQLKEPPPVPTTSIYSRTDGVVAWQCSVNPNHPHTENIEVHASHIGMGMNPLALYAIADRLRQDPAHWQRFDLRGARRWFYKVTHHSPLQASAAL